MTITIDGPAGSGKTTTAKKVAEKLGYLHLDSGALYRAATLQALRLKIDLQNKDLVVHAVEKANIDLFKENGCLRIYLNGKDITDAIRLPEVTKAIKYIASNPAVRDILTCKQRNLAQNGSVVVEGRDTGTVVFPNADLKIYLVASIEERAERRHLELSSKGITVDFKKLRDEIENRDHSDSARKYSPLKKPEDAIVLNTSDLTIEQQVDFVVREARKRGA
ncbi:MAG: (d)CMP kinase [Actinobacteria bacterium]|nr:(d)CMP kinase [Actinomycetota bacterium]